MERIASTAGKRRGESDGSGLNAIDGVYTMHTIGGSEFNKNMGKRHPTGDGERDASMVLRDDIPQSSPNKVVIKSAGRRTHSSNTSQESILRAESRHVARSSSDDAALREANAKGIRVTTAFGVED